MTRSRSAHVSRHARLPGALNQCGPGRGCLSLLAWLPTHPWLDCSIPCVCSPGLHFLLIQTTWDPCCGVSRQKREPQPPSGCQGGWQEGASPPGVSWETASSPEKGHLEIKFLPLCVCMCVGAGEGVKKPHHPPSAFLSSGKASFSSSPDSLPKLQPIPQKPRRLCWEWTRGLENVPSDS